MDCRRQHGAEREPRTNTGGAEAGISHCPRTAFRVASRSRVLQFPKNTTTRQATSTCTMYDCFFFFWLPINYD